MLGGGGLSIRGNTVVRGDGHGWAHSQDPLPVSDTHEIEATWTLLNTGFSGVESCSFVGLSCEISEPLNTALCTCGGKNAHQFGFEISKPGTVVDGVHHQSQHVLNVVANDTLVFRVKNHRLSVTKNGREHPEQIPIVPGRTYYAAVMINQATSWILM